MQYKITDVKKLKEYEGKYGKLVSYSIQIDGEWVQLSQKPETPAPQIGSEIEGSITDTEYGKKFKKASANFTRADTASISWGEAYSSATRVAKDFCSIIALESTPTPETIEDYVRNVDRVAIHIKGIADKNPKSVDEIMLVKPKQLDETPTDEEVDNYKDNIV